MIHDNIILVALLQSYLIIINIKSVHKIYANIIKEQRCDESMYMWVWQVSVEFYFVRHQCPIIAELISGTPDKFQFRKCSGCAKSREMQCHDSATPVIYSNCMDIGNTNNNNNNNTNNIIVDNNVRGQRDSKDVELRNIDKVWNDIIFWRDKTHSLKLPRQR